ncbi:DNA ligase [Alcanivorax sp. MD8A]|uniref:DNA ligase n=1 Tax=Alcanivorax sp. MD8A TaxID=1177157 RepID=UPI000C9BD8BE|nr:DNA ligase [Alcanivorax sp. MD8A]PNE01465.1 DNA ligase [Alcanivorax sp. MD8A]
MTVFLKSVCVFLFSIALVAAAQPPALQLAKVYQPGMPLDGYWVSEKLDGVRAYWDGAQLWSKGGNRIAAPEWFTRGYPDQAMEGELWMGRGRFAEVSAAVRRLRPQAQEWRQIRLMLFDLPESRQPFAVRVQEMRALVAASSSYTLEVVTQTPATDHDRLMQQLDKVMARGGEGLMLHHGDSVYHAGRSDAVLKVKSYQDAEARVTGHVVGQGKFAGMLGALQVETDDGRRFRLGTGFSDAERRDPPPIGSTVTFKYYGLTATGLPRFASFLRVRRDEPLN